MTTAAKKIKKTVSKKRKSMKAKSSSSVKNKADSLYSNIDINKEVDSKIMWGFGIAISFPFIALYTIPILFVPFLKYLYFVLPITSIFLTMGGMSRLKVDKNSLGRGFGITSYILSTLYLLILVLIFIFNNY